MMKPLQIAEGKETETTYACIHWRSFPSFFAGRDIQVLRSKGEIDPSEYQRHLVWERECGVTQMSGEKCLTCTHCRRLVVTPSQVPKLVSLTDPNDWTPAVDLPTFESVGRYRKA